MTSLSKLVLKGLMEPGGAVTVTTNVGGDQLLYLVRDRLGRVREYPEEYRMRSWGDGGGGADEDMD